MTRRKNPFTSDADLAALYEYGAASGLSRGDVDDLVNEVNDYVEQTNPETMAWAAGRLADTAFRSIDAKQDWRTLDELQARMAIARFLLRAVTRIASRLRQKVQ